jgi:hypothetical protein
MALTVGWDNGTWWVQQEESLLDDIIARLLDVRNGRPGKQVQLTENDIRQLCMTAREVFQNQPNLLELEAPIKICGTRRLPPSPPPHSSPTTAAERDSELLVGQPVCLRRGSTCSATYPDAPLSGRTGGRRRRELRGQTKQTCARR